MKLPLAGKLVSRAGHSVKNPKKLEVGVKAQLRVCASSSIVAQWGRKSVLDS